MKSREQELINQFKKGSKKAFEAIYNNHYVFTYQFAKRFVSNAQDAEDITTEVFLKLWGRHEDFDRYEKIVAFLYISTRNACLNHLRNEKRQLTGQKELLYLLEDETGQYLEQQQITARIYQYILSEIDKLPRQLKKVFTLAYIEGRSNEEIAETLKINNQSVRNHKARALKLLRIALMEQGLLEIFILLWPFLYPD
jgi:RNA polymerase sigma-70 factor (family 1)